MHKEGIPLRPITSSRNSPKAELSEFLLPIITTFDRENTSHVKKIIKSIPVEPDEGLVSFEGESLYTNVSALEVGEKRLTEDSK